MKQRFTSIDVKAIVAELKPRQVFYLLLEVCSNFLIELLI
jgi:predicted ribosome quality control (RQC) complex YloA/Tae2 family protein